MILCRLIFLYLTFKPSQRSLKREIIFGRIYKIEVV